MILNHLSANVKAANSIDLGMFKLRFEESIVDPIKLGSLFSRFKSSISASPNTRNYCCIKCFDNNQDNDLFFLFIYFK